MMNMGIINNEDIVNLILEISEDICDIYDICEVSHLSKLDIEQFLNSFDKFRNIKYLSFNEFFKITKYFIING